MTSLLIDMKTRCVVVVSIVYACCASDHFDLRNFIIFNRKQFETTAISYHHRTTLNHNIYDPDL